MCYHRFASSQITRNCKRAICKGTFRAEKVRNYSIILIGTFWCIWSHGEGSLIPYRMTRNEPVTTGICLILLHWKRIFVPVGCWNSQGNVVCGFSLEICRRFDLQVGLVITFSKWNIFLYWVCQQDPVHKFVYLLNTKASTLALKELFGRTSLVCKCRDLLEIIN